MRGKLKSESGFSVIELMVAVLILMIGVVAVAQLVPNAMRLNLANRYDSTAVVIAQRVMEILLDQPVVNCALPPCSVQARVFAPPQSLAGTLRTFNLGVPGAPGGMAAWRVYAPIWLPSATYVTPQGRIDWTQAAVNGYSFEGVQGVVDPTDVTGQSYDVRWAVATQWGLVGGATGTPTLLSKRIVVSVRRSDISSQLIPPTSLTVVRTNGIM